ncbi:MAG: hypothetical protein ACRBCS_08625 [Cellvibrionaceae bacterium]
MIKLNILLNMTGLVIASFASMQLHAGDSISIQCGNGKTVKLEKSNYKRGSDAMICTRAGYPTPMKNAKKGSTGVTKLGAPKDSGAKQGLLLPAVQAAREAGAPAQVKPINSTLGTANTTQTADTTCTGTVSCNDMIATCAALGGNVTPTSYDPDSGAPNGATCFPAGK